MDIEKSDINAPDQAIASDITYIPTDEGWLYLAALMDMNKSINALVKLECVYLVRLDNG